MDTKTLIAYFSRKGPNYVNGSIQDLPVGNTEVAAGLIAELTGAALFQIEPARTYARDYKKCTEEAQAELRANVRPEILTQVADMDGYDTIILGYPNWWGTMPMPVWTFLEGYDLSGKTILPFCTHEGSGMGHSERDIKTLCPNAKVGPGLALQGGTVQHAKPEIARWLKQAGR